MSTYLINSGTLDDIADAIRAKTGGSANITPLEMPEEIASISGGGHGVVTKYKKVLIGSEVVGYGSGSASTSVTIPNVKQVILNLWLWCPDVTQSGTVSISVNGESQVITDYDYYTYTDAYHAVRTYILDFPNGVDMASVGYTFSGLAYNTGSRFHGEITVAYDVDASEDGLVINSTERIFEGTTETGVGSGGDYADNLSVTGAVTVLLKLTLKSPDISTAGTIKIQVNSLEYGVSSYTSYNIDSTNQVRYYTLVLPDHDIATITKLGYSFSGISYDASSEVTGEMLVQHGTFLADILINRVFYSGYSGASSFTTNKKGIYLILTCCGYGGSLGISLPSGVTPILQNSYNASSRLWRYAIVELEKNVTVGVTSTFSGNYAFGSKTIFDITNLNIGSSSSEITGSGAVSDTTKTLTPPSDTFKYLLFGSGLGRSYASYTNPAGKSPDDSYSASLATNTVVELYYGDGDKLPAVSLYGYDGGGGCVVGIKI